MNALPVLPAEPADGGGVAVVPAEGQPEIPIFLPDDGLILWRGAEIELPVKPTKFLSLLLRYRPHFVSRERAMLHFWPAGADSAGDMITAYYGQLKKVLLAHEVPLEVRARQGFGYRVTGQVEIRRVEV